MIKPLQYLTRYDPNLSIGENWRVADPLNYAWLAYSSPELADRYRDSGSRPETAGSLQFEMRLELRDRIANSEITALGIPITLSGNSEPQVIPAHFFAADSVKLDWEADTISGLGRKFAEVRICLSTPSPEQNLELIDDKAIPAKRGGGRRNLYPDAKIILDELLRDPIYAAMPAEPLRGPFNDLFVTRYSTSERKVAAVSERALRNYLKLYRQELAKIGRN